MPRLRCFPFDHPTLSNASRPDTDRSAAFPRLAALRQQYTDALGGDEDWTALVLDVTDGTSLRRYAAAAGRNHVTVRRRFKAGLRRIRHVLTLAHQADLHWRANGGFTFDVAARTAVAVPAHLAAVSIRGFERTADDRDGSVVPAVVRYVGEHWDHFRRTYRGRPLHLGGWARNGRLVLDVSVIVPLAEAPAWCTREGQEWYYSGGQNYRAACYRHAGGRLLAVA